MLKLRGHHLLCVHGFQGEGYSPDFIEKMTEVVAFIRDVEQDGLIQVKGENDHVCKACPHLGEKGCRSAYNAEEKIQKMDRRVFHHLGIQTGEIYGKNELVRLTREKVIPDDLDHLCEGCSWLRFGMCKEGIAQLRKGRTLNTD